MGHTRRDILKLGVATVLAAPRLAAAKVARLTLADMLTYSSTIVIGTVTAIRIEHNTRLAMIAVEKVVRGEVLPSPLSVHAESTWRCDLSGAATAGVRGLFFLRPMKNDDGRAYLGFTHSGRGYLPIVNGEVEVHGSEIVLPPEWAIDPEESYERVSVPVDDLVAWIEAQPPMSFPDSYSMWRREAVTAAE